MKDKTLGKTPVKQGILNSKTVAYILEQMSCSFWLRVNFYVLFCNEKK